MQIFRPFFITSESWMIISLYHLPFRFSECLPVSDDYVGDDNQPPKRCASIAMYSFYCRWRKDAYLLEVDMSEL